MILRFKDFSVNELVKNVKSVEFHAEKLKEEVMSISSDISFRLSKEDVYSVIEISKLKDFQVTLVNNLLSKMREKLSREDLMVSYSQNDSCPVSENIQIIVFIKNIHTKRVVPERFVYHFTDQKNVDNILKTGLLPMASSKSSDWNMKSLEYPPAIFAVNDSKTLWKTGAILRIDTKGLDNKWWQDLNFPGESPAIMTFEPIPATHISLVSHADRKSDIVPVSVEKENILDKAKSVVLSGQDLDSFFAEVSDKDLLKVCGHMSLVAATRGKEEVLDYLYQNYKDMVDWQKVNQWKSLGRK